jgi:hypothetical protein
MTGRWEMVSVRALAYLCLTRLSRSLSRAASRSLGRNVPVSSLNDVSRLQAFADRQALAAPHTMACSVLIHKALAQLTARAVANPTEKLEAASVTRRSRWRE